MKNLIIAAIIGVAFMTGGFWYGLRLKPVPPPHSKEVSAPATVAAAPAPPPISIETLKKTSETMMALNEALQARERNVAEREQKAQEREDELSAERGALDRSHEKFKALFNEFQQRLQLVEASQLDQLQKQAELYSAMGTTQSIELIRAMDDSSMTRLFSVMDIKPLSKLVAEWKTKYPEDTPRLLHALDGMAQVMPKDKIALSDPTTAPDSTSPASPAPAANPSPDAPAPDAPATPSPAADPSSQPAPVSTPPANSTPDTGLTPPSDPTSAPVSTATTN